MLLHSHGEGNYSDYSEDEFECDCDEFGDCPL